MPQKYSTELDTFDRELRSKGYTPLEPFFILREADIADERTGGKVRLNKERLERIAETQNQRVATTGDATPIIVGHTRRHLLEKEQPPIAGLATRYTVEKFLNTNSWGLKAVPWCKPENKVLFQQFPRRSCELWTDPDLIDPISLLGANTPRLDLGLHQLSRDQQLAQNLGYTPRIPLSLEMCGSMADDNDAGGNGDSGKPATPKNVDAAEGTQTSEFAQLKSQVDQLTQMMGFLQPLIQELQMGGAGDPAGGGAPPPGPGGPPPGPMGPAPGPVQAMGTPPGGMNAMVPQQFGRQDGPMQFQHYGYAADGTPLYRQAAVQQPMQFGQPVFTPPTPAPQPQPAQAEVERLRTQVASLQLARLGDEVNMVLNDLEKKIVIDRQRDYNELIKLEKPQRDQAIQFMLTTRKQVEEPLPPQALPLEFHREPPQMPVQIQNAPIQLGALGDSLYMPGDPNLGKPRPGAPVAASTYDTLMDIVRNRGKLSSTEAFDHALAAARNGSANGIPVR